VASGSTRGRSSPAPPATAAATPIPASKIQSIRDVYGPHADLYRDVLLLPQPEAVTPATLRTAYFRRARQVLTTPKQPSLPKQPSPVSATANVNDYQHDDDAAMAPTAKDRFQAVTKAFEILSNPSWKAYYQEHGLEVEMVEAAAAAAEPSQLVDLLLDNNDYPLPPGAARPILKRRSRSWGPVVSRRSSRTSRLRWNEEVEELVYLPESSENEDDEEEEAQQADGAGSGSSNRRSKKKKKKRHKPVIVIENNPEELFAEHELEDRYYTHDFLDDIEASLDGLGANLGGLVQKYADSINSFSSKQDDDDDDDDSCKYTTLSSKGEEQEQPSKEQQQGEDKTQAATTGKTSSRLGRAANKEQSQQSEMESDDSETEQKMLVKDLLAGFTKPPPIIDSNQLELDEEQQECERLQEQTNKETGGTQASLSLSASSSGETAKKAEEKKKLAPPRERKAKERRLEASSASVGEKLKAEKKSVVATSKDEEHEVVLMSAESSFASTTPQVEPKEEKSARAATASSSVKEEGPAKSPRGKLKPLVKKKTTVKVVPIEAFDPFESDSVAIISGIAFDGEEEQGQVKSRESPSPPSPPYHHLATDAKNQKNEIATDAAAAAEQEDNSAANAWTTEPKFGQSARVRPVLSSRTSRDFDIPRDSSILAASSVGSATENGKSKTTYSLKTNIAVSTPSKDGASVNVLKAFSFDSALNTTLGDDTIFADLSRSAEDATQELKSSMDSKTKDFKSAMESRTKDFKSAMGTSANAFVSSSTEVARQLQGMFDGVAKQAEGVAKQAEESFRAISPGPVQDARQDAESARASASSEPSTVGSGVSSGANGEGTVPPEGEGSLFDAFNRYIKSLAQDVGLLGIVFNENVAEANRTMVDSFVVPEEEMDGMLHVLETELNASRNDDRITKSFTY